MEIGNNPKKGQNCHIKVGAKWEKKQLRTVPRGLMIAENQGKDSPEELKDFRE